MWALVALVVIKWAVSNLETIKSIPGLRRFGEFMMKRDVPETDPSRYTVAVCRLDHDDDNAEQRLVVESLSEFPAIQALALDDRIRVRGQDPEQAVAAGHEKARRLLLHSGIDIVIWGTRLRRNETSVLKLYLTQSAVPDLASHGERYFLSTDLELPLSDYLVEILQRRPSRKGKVFDLEEPKKFVKWVRDQSGVHFTVHDLRRSFITHAEKQDLGLYTLKALINHSTKKTGDVTEGYIQIDIERLREPMQRITSYILGLAGVAKDNVVQLEREHG